VLADRLQCAEHIVQKIGMHHRILEVLRAGRFCGEFSEQQGLPRGDGDRLEARVFRAGIVLS